MRTIFLSDVGHKLISALELAFPALKVCLLPTTGRIILNQRASGRMSPSASHLVCQFTSGWGGIYIRSTDQILLHQISEYSSKWLIKSVSQNTMNNYPYPAPGSTTARHIIANKDTTDFVSCFKPMLQNTDRKNLASSGAILIPLCDPVIAHKINNTDSASAMKVTSILCWAEFKLCACALQFTTGYCVINGLFYTNG